MGTSVSLTDLNGGVANGGTPLYLNCSLSQSVFILGNLTQIHCHINGVVLISRKQKSFVKKKFRFRIDFG